MTAHKESAPLVPEEWHCTDCGARLITDAELASDRCLHCLWGVHDEF